MKNIETSGKVNQLLNEIRILNNKLQENQTKVPEVLEDNTTKEQPQVQMDVQVESQNEDNQIHEGNLKLDVANKKEASKDQMDDVQIDVETEDVETAKQPEEITGKEQAQVLIDVQMESQEEASKDQMEDAQIEVET